MKRAVVLTGGIGTGKSTVARRLAEAGATVIEADRVGHDVLAPHGAAFAEVAARWPEVVVDGGIDRRALGRIVFGDPNALGELEAMTHPAIRREVLRRVADASGLVVVEVPVAAPWLPDDWPRVVVDAPDDVRVARLRARGMDDDEIAARRSVQPDRDGWLALADHVVDNAGSVEDLDACVASLFDELGAAPGD